MDSALNAGAMAATRRLSVGSVEVSGGQHVPKRKPSNSSNVSAARTATSFRSLTPSAYTAKQKERKIRATRISRSVTLSDLAQYAPSSELVEFWEGGRTAVEAGIPVTENPAKIDFYVCHNALPPESWNWVQFQILCMLIQNEYSHLLMRIRIYPMTI